LILLASPVLELLKVLVIPKLHKERKKHVKRLHYRLIIRCLVHRDVAHTKHQACIVTYMHIDFGSRELDLLQSLLHFWLPLLHQRVEFRHRFRVVHCGRRPCPMQILYSADPSRYLFRLLICLLDRVNIHWRRANYIFLHILHLQYGLVLAVERGFVQYRDTKIFVGTVWLLHLEESIYLADCRHVFWNKRSNFGFKINFLRLESLDVFK